MIYMAFHNISSPRRNMKMSRRKLQLVSMAMGQHFDTANKSTGPNRRKFLTKWTIVQANTTNREYRMRWKAECKKK